AEKYGLAEMASGILSLRALALALLGRHDDVLALVRGFPDSNLLSSRLRFRDLVVCLGQACLEAGLIEDGVRVVESFGSGDEPWGTAATVDLLKGSLLPRRNPPDWKAAESCLQRSMQWYRATNSRFGELQGAAALARVLLDTGRRDEARAMLAEVYGWFTEG